MGTNSYLDAFDAALAEEGKSAVTRHGYLADLKDYMTWERETYGEAFDPAGITREDVRAYKAHLEGRGRKCKPATTRRKLAALRAFCQWAIDEGLLEADPTAGVKAAKQTPPAPKAISRVERNRLVRKAQRSGKPLHAAVVTMLAHTGLRVGELCELALGDVQINSRSGTLAVHGKGNKLREVPLNAEVRRELAAYFKVRPAPAAGVPADRLFISQRGQALTPSGVWRTLDKYAQQAGIEEDVSPHVLRHTFATLLLREEGQDLVTVAQLMGHENLTTTMRYTLANKADLAAAVEALAKP